MKNMTCDINNPQFIEWVAIGRAEGELEEKMQTAKRMLDMGVDKDRIAKYTRLKPELIQRIEEVDRRNSISRDRDERFYVEGWIAS